MARGKGETNSGLDVLPLDALQGLSTANLADAVIRLGLPIRLAPEAIKPIWPGATIFGPARPVQHAGSVDIFLEALGAANPGDIIVIENHGLSDEGAIGDLIVREFKHAGAAGVVLWGAHRDTREILEIGLPVFSQGAYPSGPTRVNYLDDTALKRARIGDAVVTPDDIVMADDDGIIFFDAKDLDAIASEAAEIRELETLQAARQDVGESLRQQFRFEEYLKRREDDTDLTFRKYLQDIEGAIEQ